MMQTRTISYYLFSGFHCYAYLRVAFLVEVNVVVEEFHKELDLCGGIHALIDNADSLLKALEDSFLIMKLKTTK